MKINPTTTNPNIYRLIPNRVTKIEEFNEYVEKLSPGTAKLIFTPSGGISFKNLRNMPCSVSFTRGNRKEFLYMDGDKTIRVIYAPYFDNKYDDSDTDVVTKTLDYFKGILSVIPDDKHLPAVELKKYGQCDKQYYDFINERYRYLMLENVSSIDRNSAFPDSMKKVFPETAPWVDKYYEDKKKDGSIKPYGVIIVGWLRNPATNHNKAWTMIMNHSNGEAFRMQKLIEKAGNVPLLVNTDAVKFIHDHEIMIPLSDKIGKYKIEFRHTNMYMKGIKSYAYLGTEGEEAGKWQFRQSGICSLDKIKPREEWTIDDFIEGETSDKEGIITDEDGTLKKILVENVRNKYGKIS